MSEVLNQGEIDALLTTVAAEPRANKAGSARPGRSGGAIKPADTISYDFRRPERVSKDQIRAIGSIHEAFARNFGATLSGILRTIMDARVVGVEQLTYSEFTHSLPNPTCFNVLQAPPLEGQMCLEISPLIVYPILDRLLGGNNGNLFIPQRPLTPIEWRLLERIVDRALEHLSDAWKNLVEAQFEMVDAESNPQLVHIVAPSEIVVFITFEIKFGSTAGTMSLCIPYNTIESVLSQLASQSWFYKPKSAAGTHQTRLLRNMSRSSVSMRALLGRTSIKFSELRALQKGDLLPLDKRANRDLLIQIDDKNKFAGIPGDYRGRRAMRLTRLSDADEPL